MRTPHEQTPPPDRDDPLPGLNTPALENPAIALCVGAWRAAYRATLAELGPEAEYSAECQAAAAYRRAMPSLSAPENIRDYIACIAYGLQIDAIKPQESSKFLYAAQVSASALRHLPRTAN